MKIPQYIKKALHSRTIAAEKWNSADYVISKFIIKNNLENDIASEDYAGGVEAIVNPYESELLKLSSRKENDYVYKKMQKV